jgi:hypothetical protein
MSDLDPLLSDAEIRERLRSLEEPNFDHAERASFAEFLYDYQRGPAAEEAVRSILSVLPDDHLTPLVRKHVLSGQALGNVDYCQPDWADVVAERLVEGGFQPVDREGGGWRVGWPGGETLTGQQLCRIALLAGWLRKMSGLPGV